MEDKKVFAMPFAKIYPLLVNKAVRKGRSNDEVDQIISWLCGYDHKEIQKLSQSTITIEQFFVNAPQLNPLRKLIKGKICGVSVEEIEDEMMQNIRYLDKMIDELAKGKALEKILRKKEGEQ